MSKLLEWVNSSLERQREYARESLKVDVSEEIRKAMDAADVDERGACKTARVHSRHDAA